MPKKTDHNQRDIVATLKDMGVRVRSLHTVGNGIPDLLCAYRGRWYMVEVKNGLLGYKHTDAQDKFRRYMEAPITILTSVDEAIAWVKSL